MTKVYIRDFATRSIVHEIEVRDMTESQYDRFEMGLKRQMDLDKYYLDDDEYYKRYGKE